MTNKDSTLGEFGDKVAGRSVGLANNVALCPTAPRGGVGCRMGVGGAKYLRSGEFE